MIYATGPYKPSTRNPWPSREPSHPRCGGAYTVDAFVSGWDPEDSGIDDNQDYQDQDQD